MIPIDHHDPSPYTTIDYNTPDVLLPHTPSTPAVHHRPYKPRLLSSTARRTSSLTCLIAVLCGVLWTLIILAGIVILIVYLAFRPHSPTLTLPSVTLNAAYLDASTHLNADTTLLANFSNPNRKVDVRFSYIQLDLYFKGTLIATQALDTFSQRRGESTLRSVHFVTSEVDLAQREADTWRAQVAGGRVGLEVRGRFRTTSVLGGLLRYTYWLYGDCVVVVSRPPTGALLSGHCRTKR